jgi:LPS export ABC transporter protein LptC
MKTPYKIPIILTVLTVVISVALYYESKSNEVELSASNKTNKAKLKHQSVNILVNGMELVINNNEGLQKASLNAVKLKHDAEHNLTLLTSPTLEVNQPGGLWKIIANKGNIIHNKIKVKQIDKIVLSENVVITRNNFNNTTLPFITLITDSIDYYPKKDLIKTKQKVVISTKDSKTTADGLEFYKNTQKLKLLKNVVSVHQASSLSANNNLKPHKTKKS